MTKHRSYLVCNCGRRQGSPLHSPPQITPSPPEKPGRKQLLRTLGTVWDAIPAEAQEKLRAAGWREAKPDAEEVASPLDPLLQVMLANKDILPEAVKEAFEEATAEPTVAPSVKGAQKLSQATSRLRNLVKKQLSLQTQITETKEALRLLLQDMQDTTKAIAESQAKVAEAKKDLAAMLEAPENQDHSSMEVEDMVKQLGIELSDAQRTKLQELRSAKRARVENPAETFEAPPGLGTEAPQGQQGQGTEQGGQQGSQNARAGVRSRSRGRATE
eukprot:s11635_g1.t1